MAAPTVVLFGYNSSAFTQKMRMALKLRQIPYTFVVVPSMMPRPILTSAFNLTYRRIPVLAINQDIYIDTPLLLETLETHPLLPTPSTTHPSLHPPRSNDGTSTRTLSRLLGTHYTDRSWYRIMTGLVPAEVWRSSFGTDRAGLIGHKLDAEKLASKLPHHLLSLRRDLSTLEPLFAENLTSHEPWLLHTSTPSAADINLFFMFKWGRDIARGVGVHDLTGGEVPESKDGELEGIERVFTPDAFPGLWAWFESVEAYWAGLPDVETRRVEVGDEAGAAEVVEGLRAAAAAAAAAAGKDGGGGEAIPMLPTAAPWDAELDAKAGLVVGGEVSAAPEDTGKGDPVVGTVLSMSAEEIVIRPRGETPGAGEGVRVHFPRTGFVVRLMEGRGRGTGDVVAVAGGGRSKL